MCFEFDLPVHSLKQSPRRPTPKVSEQPTSLFDSREHRLLSRLASRGRVTQRELSRELGFALGLTNFLVRGLISKGWVRVRRVNRSRLLYLVTPAGIAAKARLTRSYVRETMLFYRETRDNVQAEFTRLAESLEPSECPAPIVFYGAGEISEIAYVCLQDSPFLLLGLVDPSHTRPFFGLPAFKPSDLLGERIAGQRFAQLVVTSVDEEEGVRRSLAERSVPPERVWWL